MKNTVFLVGALWLVGACADDDGVVVRLDVRDVEVSTPEDTALIVQLQVDTNRPVQATVTGQPMHGVLADMGGSFYSYTPALNYSGPDSISFTVTNGTLQDVGTVSITVTPVDDAPVAAPDNFAAGFATALTTATTTLLMNDTDIEGDALSVTEVIAATNGSVTLSGGNIVFTPAANFQGQATYVYRVSDGTMSSLGNVTVSVGVNSAPTAVNDTRTGTEDTVLVIEAATLIANDTDVEMQTLAIAAANNATHGAVAIAGNTITFTPDADYNGPATFDYVVTDGAATDNGSVTINLGAVNDAPIVANDSGFQTTEDAAFTFTAAQLLGNDSDVDGDNLTITAVGGGQNCTVSLPASLVGDIVLVTPTPNFNGTASFTYTVTDGTTTVSGTVTLTVGAVNDLPIATNDAVSGDEDTAITVGSAALLANDTDADGQTLTVTAVANPTNGTVALSSGAVTFTPLTNFNGTGSFDYTVSDGTTTDTGTVTVTVNPVNDAPEAVDDTASTPEDVALNINVLINDLDLDIEALSIMSTSQPLHGTVVVVNDVAIYTPTANYFGPDSFTYTARDGGGLTDTALVTINVTSTNDSPVALDDSVTTDEDVALTIAAAANDTDADGDALTVLSAGAPVHGTTLVVNGQVLYTPALDYNGPDSFTYTAADGNGGTASATVSIGVGPVNDAPVAVDDVYVVNDTLLMVAPGILGNDSDVDSTPLTVQLISAPATGTLTLNADGSFHFISDDCNQVETFTYVVSDGLTVSNIGTVTLQINHTPYAYDDPGDPNYSYHTTENMTLVVASPGVLANDHDPDPQPLSSQIASFPQNAQSFTLNPDGSFTYVPLPGFTGCDSFTYTAADQTTVSNQATVYITVDYSNAIIAHGGILCGPVTGPSDEVATTGLLEALRTTLEAKPRCCFGPEYAVGPNEIYGCEIYDQAEQTEETGDQATEVVQ